MAQQPTPPNHTIAWPLVVAGIVVALALGIGAGALLFNSDDGGSSSTGAAVGTAPIQLPDTLGPFRDLVEVVDSKSNGSKAAVKEQRDHQAKVKATTEAAYRKAYGGAAVAYRAYGDDTLLHMPYVIAVRTEAPGMTLGPVQDAAHLQLAVPDHEVKAFGPVECQIVRTSPTFAGKTPDPANDNALSCQRSGSGVTVFTGGGSFSGPAQVQALVDLTNAAWSAVTGS